MQTLMTCGNLQWGLPTGYQITTEVTVSQIAWYVLEVAMQAAIGAGRRRLKWEPAKTL
jgi:hypothetical protein